MDRRYIIQNEARNLFNMNVNVINKAENLLFKTRLITS